jgi:pyrroline-5-carboxylate reductase
LLRCADNAEVAARADILLLTLRPPQIAPLAEGLRLRPGQTLVSFAAGLPLARLRALFPGANVFRGLALPFIAGGDGPAAVYPASPELSALFSGARLLCLPRSEAELEGLFTAGGLMSTLARMAEVAEDRLQANGVTPGTAAGFLAAMAEAVARRTLAGDRAEGLERYETAGGLNWRCRSYLERRSWFETYRDALDHLVACRAELTAPAPPLILSPRTLPTEGV